MNIKNALQDLEKGNIHAAIKTCMNVVSKNNIETEYAKIVLSKCYLALDDLIQAHFWSNQSHSVDKYDLLELINKKLSDKFQTIIK